jgi:ribosomal protein S18 acetylase RimI-like enzyme
VTDRDAAPGVVVERGGTEDAAAVADCWVALAEGQQAHGSRLLADRNRHAAREAALRHAVTGGLFVARRCEMPSAADGISADDATATADVAVDLDAEPIAFVEADVDADPDDVLGFVTASLATGEFVEASDRGVVRNLYVRPEARGHGIGTALLAVGEAHLAAEGAAVVSLEVLAANEAARRFYRRHGYGLHRVELQRRIDDR